MTYYAIELALWMTAPFLAGCLIGAVLRLKFRAGQDG